MPIIACQHKDRRGGASGRRPSISPALPQMPVPRPGSLPDRPAVWISALCSVVLTLAGCEVGRDFTVPPAPENASYAADGPVKSTASSPGAEGAAQTFREGRDIPGGWWRLYRSRHLNDLIARSLAANPGLQASQAALRQARENLYAQEGTLFPTIDANGSATRQRFNPASFGFPGKPFIFNLFQATANVAYAPDVFGGKRRQIESARAQADYQRFELEASYLTLTANVVTAAIQQASLRAQIETTQDIINSQNQQLVVVRTQFAAGTALRTDVLAQETELAQTQATLPALEKQLAMQDHLLTALTGQFPNQRRAAALSLAELHLPSALPVSLPSALVEQRPDLRAAEEQLHQASAQIGVAVANMLPQLNLTADYGSNGLTPGVLFTPQTTIWSAAAAVSQPIFHGAQLYHQERAAVAAYEQAEAQYRNTVVTAFQNVADAMRALADDARALQAQERAARVSSESYELSRMQYQEGTITYLTLLNAQRAVEQAKLNLVQAQAARLADTAALFQALGGGWWNRTDVAPDDRPPPTIMDILTGSR
jgi:NodT family efflux transporter outer membrane factor (OMF) lipoprotein